MKNILTKQVGVILELFPESTNCDKYLTMKVWDIYYSNFIEEVYGNKTIKLENILHLPKEDYISRIRRKFQEKGLYLPTDPNIRLKRKLHQASVERWAINN